MTQNSAETLFNIRLDVLVCLFLVISTLAVYWQVNKHEFIGYDDDRYVTGNVRVQSGLTTDNVKWAFKTTTVSNWHPLTWLSHMADVELYGLAPGAHHMTSVLFHIINSLLVFIVFKRMTASLWQSAFVAALFALHPLHVESVAWVAERKDVLSTFFWLLTMFSYARYAAHPGVKRYIPVVVFFILGLMAKPMLVTLPFVLFLLDCWPLRRIRFDGSGENKVGGLPRRSPGLWLVWEKIPLFLLAFASSVVTFAVQKKGGAVGSMEIYPLFIRAANALVAYAKYIGKMIWPANLAAFYPYSDRLPGWQVVGAGVLLVLITFAALRTLRQRPWFAVGWLWFVGTLVPVIGLVQVGLQAMADRYTYVPLIGLFIIVAWGVPELIGKWRHKQKLLATAASVLLAAFIATSWLQTRHWQNSNALFKHALDVTDNNYFAHNALGSALKGQGKTDEARGHYLKALEIRPDYPAPHYNIGHTLAHQGLFPDAIEQFQKAIQIKPDYAAAHDALGYIFMIQEKFEEASFHYSEALRIKPNDAEVHNRFGLALAGQGHLNKAVNHFFKSVTINPSFAAAHYNLGDALMNLGRLNEAISHYTAGLRLKPDHAEAHNNLGAAMIRAGMIREAVPHFEAALRLKPGYEHAQKNLKNTLAALEDRETADRN